MEGFCFLLNLKEYDLAENFLLIMNQIEFHSIQKMKLSAQTYSSQFGRNRKPFFLSTQHRFIIFFYFLKTSLRHLSHLLLSCATLPSSLPGRTAVIWRTASEGPAPLPRVNY